MECDKSKNTLTDEQLQKIVKQHELWLQTNKKSGKRADLSNHILVGVNLQHKNLREAILNHIDLRNSNLKGITMIRTNLYKANLSNSNLEFSELSEANLSKANLNNADLSEANLSEANLSSVIFNGTDVNKTNFNKSILNYSNIEYARNWKLAVNFPYEYFPFLFNNNSNFSTIQQEILQLRHKLHIYENDLIFYQKKQIDVENLEKQLQQAQQEAKEGKQNSDEIKYLHNQLIKLQYEQNNKQMKAERAQAEADRLRIELTQKEQEHIQQIEQHKKELEETKITKLNEQIDFAQKVLSKSLESADKRIAEHTRTAKYIGSFSMGLIGLDVILISLFPLMIWFGDFSEKSTLFKLADKFGSWSFALYTFPIVLILLLATTLFRHQKKLLDEIRHFSATKHQIELYSGLLKASQHAAAGLGDTEQSAKYVQETFTEIRNRLLQQHANDNLSSIINNEGESYSQDNILVLLEKIVDLGGKKTGN